MIVEQFPLDIEANEIPWFVGPQQSGINKIEDQTNTFIYVKRPHQDGKDEEETVAEIIGKPDDVDRAFGKVLDRSLQVRQQEYRPSKLQLENPSRNKTTKHVGEKTIKHRVPVRYHFRFMGPGGSEVKRLAKRFRTRIEFPKKEYREDFITLTGTEENLCRAKEYFDRAVQSYKDLNRL